MQVVKAPWQAQFSSIIGIEGFQLLVDVHTFTCVHEDLPLPCGARSLSKMYIKSKNEDKPSFMLSFLLHFLIVCLLGFCVLYGYLHQIRTIDHQERIIHLQLCSRSFMYVGRIFALECEKKCASLLNWLRSWTTGWYAYTSFLVTTLFIYWEASLSYVIGGAIENDW